jgi:hypothetical protein
MGQARPRPRKRLLTGLGVTLLTLIAVSAAGAAQQFTTPIFSPQAHPCTGEPVALQGTVHTTVQTQGDGTIHVFFNFQGGNGVGLVTGARYSAADNSKTFILLPDFSITEYVRFVRSGETTTTTGAFGGGDDFFARFRFSSTGPPVIDLVCQ